MKKYIILFFFLGLSVILPTSCLEEYLDKAPEAGLTTEEVFSRNLNFKLFFNAVYDGRKRYGTNWREYNIKCGFPFYFNMWDQKYTWEGLTDMADMGRYMEGQTIKSGQISSIVNKFTYDGDRRPILESMFMCIRICNITLKNIHLLKDVEQVEIDDYIAQAHFVRAFCHFELFRIWGPMPYITEAMEPGGQFDIPRLSKHETLMRIAADMDTAANYFEKCGRMRRDAMIPGSPGHLSDPNQARPNGVAAKAFKARAMLYAASPLNNELGVKDWEEAAKANWEAIQVALQYGYTLLPAAEYKNNYTDTRYTNEQLWGWYAGNYAHNNGNLQGIVASIFTGSTSSTFSGECPTQNFVDKFETKWGEPLETDADRAAATTVNHYKEQDPYKDRDPRFYIDVIYNQATLNGWSGGKAQIYYEIKNGSPVYSELLNQSYLGITRTGYYTRKRVANHSTKAQGNKDYTDPIIRLGELYLNYAEAANEAYGPSTPAPGATMNAIQAINLIRTRIAMPNVLAKYTTDKDAFRPRIKNERTIELCFEGHYYHDIRRWKDAPVTMAGPLMGMTIEKVPVSTTYPLGFKHTRTPLTSDRQSTWKDAMYYLPFNTEDNFKMKNFVPNEVW